MNRIVISYRRQDSADVTGRIYDRLVTEFGRENVFKDVDAIPAGVDFRHEIGKAVGQSAVFLVVIGDQWLTVLDEDRRRRIDSPTDFVRVEVEAALQRDIRVIPVLVRGASMPSEAELPEPLRALTFRNAIPVRNDPDFHHDIDRLIRSIAAIVRPAATPARDEAPNASVLPSDTMTVQARLMRQSMREIEEEMKRRLIGQEHAVDQIMPWVKRLRFGLPRVDRPAAVFAFIGQSGIGKTVFAKELARITCGAEDRLVFFEMGHFTGPSAVSLLLGAPAGYVGYGEGRIVNALRDFPESVFFFDEVEKADPIVLDLLLRFADEGFVQDAAGPIRDGRKAILILSTNVTLDATSLNAEHDGREQMTKAMLNYGARPEFVGRMDEVIWFLPLSRSASRKMVDMWIEREVLALRDGKGIRLSVDEKTREVVAQDFYALSQREGARAAPRVVHNRLLVPVIDFLFEHEVDQEQSRPVELAVTCDSQGRIVVRWTA